MGRITGGNGGTGERPGSNHRASFGMLSRIRLHIGLVSASALMLLALVAVLAGCGGKASEATGSATLLTGAGAANTVTVNGDATVTSAPDEAVIVLTVENDAATAPAAMDATDNVKGFRGVGLKVMNPFD